MTERKSALLRARGREAPWTELREQRVLRRVLAALETIDAPSGWRAVRRVHLALAASLLLAAGSAFLFLSQRSVPGNGSALAPVAPATAHRKLKLSDGSELDLTPGADARLVQQSPRAIRVQQPRGRVHYRVAHDPERAFTIQVADIEVRVRGTEFTVDLADDSVAVHVRSGRVEIDDGSRVTTLLRGEDLRVRAYSAREQARPSATLGDPNRAFEAAAPSGALREPSSSAASPPKVDDRRDPVDELFRTVTEARSSGQSDLAAARLREIVRGYPRDPRIPSAYFTLGRVERVRGAHAAAARAFTSCESVSPRGTLAHEALAEAAASWLSAGQQAQAARVARRYLERFRNGSHAERMQAIVE